MMFYCMNDPHIPTESKLSSVSGLGSPYARAVLSIPASVKWGVPGSHQGLGTEPGSMGGRRSIKRTYITTKHY